MTLSEHALKISLEDKYSLDHARAYMTGIEALVRLPMLQHQRDVERGLNTAGFISGYRGSPLGSVDQAMWKAKKYLDKHNIHFVPGVNEDLAATAVRGSQEVDLFPNAKYDGVFGMWYGKGPGVDRSMDVIKHANAVGTSKFGGVLAVAGDDHAAKSSTLPHQSEHMFIGASIPVLAPANVQEVLDLGIYGWELSRYAGCWVALKAITENMDSAISAEIDAHRVKIMLPETFEMPLDGVHARWPDSPLAQELRLNKYKIYAARAFARANNLNRIVIDSPKARLGIVTSGKAYLDVLQALEDLGIDQGQAAAIGLRVYKVGMPWPLEPLTTHEFAAGLEEILVVEEKRSIIEDQITGQLYNWPVADRPRVIGEFDEQGKDLLPNLSELTPAIAARAIASRIRYFYKSDEIEKRLKFYDQKEQSIANKHGVINRSPHYCSGCPHNSSTVVPEGSVALGGIGCHYMSTWMPTRPATTFTQMGGEGVTWVGQAAFTNNKHVFQNLGDGTYFHSGSLAIRQVVAAGVNITYKILYNDAVAMTGGQPLDGSLTVKQLIMQLRGEGIKRIALVSDHPENYSWSQKNGLTISHRDDLLTIETELQGVPGASVLIFEQTCAAEKRRRRKKGLMVDPKRRIFINEAVCEGCGDCGKKSNCLSVLPKETELGRKRQIDQSGCNKDYSCVNGFCPSFVSVIGGTPKKNTAVAADSFGVIPMPVLPTIIRPWNLVVTGVGGTGVLTITAVLGMAAHIEGKGCATMNQTGLAQKFGPVVSHLRVANKQEDINTVRIPAGDADLLLGCDLVVSSSDEAIAKVNVERTVAVINDTEMTTAEFIYNRDAEFPSDAMKQLIIDEVGEGKVNFINATELASHLLGDTLASNFFMLGYAFQKGYVPVSYDAIDRAIELNGVAADFNKQAFLWGRHAAHDIDAVRQAAGVELVHWSPLNTVDDIIQYRYQHLLKYQDKYYADKYIGLLSAVSAKDKAINGVAGELTSVIAKSLHKLMAYKDEYEVARLYTDGEFLKKLNDAFEGDYKLQFHMAPPLLAKIGADGFPVKRAFSTGMLVAFKVLAKCKGLRGTRWDIFGYSADRRAERALRDDFTRQLSHLLPQLRKDNVDIAIELFGLIDDIRGFGHIKEAAISQYRVRRNHLLKRFNGDIVQLVDIDNAA